MSKRKRLWIGCVCLAVGLCCVGAIALSQPNLRYLIKETLAGWFKAPLTLTEIPAESLSLERSSLEDLLEDVRTEYNQALLLVNTQYLLDETRPLDIAEYKDSGVLMNRCIHDAYEALAAEAYARFGKKLYVMSAYRDAEHQAEIAAQEDADTAAAVGASEHQTGLALDVYVAQYAGDGFLQSETGQYVNAHCQDFGFIIRYPAGGQEITGIRFEPWHIRYVGAPHAAFISESKITLEEYIAALEPGGFYQIGTYIVSRQSAESIELPAAYKKLTVSPDNTGYYILTIET